MKNKNGKIEFILISYILIFCSQISGLCQQNRQYLNTYAYRGNLPYLEVRYRFPSEYQFLKDINCIRLDSLIEFLKIDGTLSKKSELKRNYDINNRIIEQHSKIRWPSSDTLTFLNITKYENDFPNRLGWRWDFDLMGIPIRNSPLREISIFDDDNNLRTRNIYRFDEEEMSYVPYKQTDYEYYEDGSIDNFILSEIKDGVYSPKQKITYYRSNENLTILDSVTNYVFLDEIDDWRLVDLKEYFYDENFRIIETKEYSTNWFETEEEIEKSLGSRDSIQYNNDGSFHVFSFESRVLPMSQNFYGLYRIMKVNPIINETSRDSVFFLDFETNTFHLQQLIDFKYNDYGAWTEMIINNRNQENSSDLWAYKEAYFSSCNGISIFEINEIQEEFCKYPNPFNRNHTINCNLETEKAIFNLYDLTGRKVFSKTIIGSNPVNINQNLPKGIYIFTVENNREIFCVNKLFYTNY